MTKTTKTIADAQAELARLNAAIENLDDDVTRDDVAGILDLVVVAIDAGDVAEAFRRIRDANEALRFAR